MSAKHNTSNSISRDLALRIGLAAQAGDIGARELVEALIAHLELPLTGEKLAKLSATDLSELLDGKVDADSVEKMADLLTGVSAVSAEPLLEPYAEGDMPGSIRVAVASSGGEMLDGHFASCTAFMIYQVSPDEIRLIDSCPTASAIESDDKTAAMVELIRDCHVLFVVSIGGPAAAKVIKAGIHPIKRPQGGPAREVVGELQKVLAGSPPPWLAKVLGAAPEERIRFTTEAA